MCIMSPIWVWPQHRPPPSHGEGVRVGRAGNPITFNTMLKITLRQGSEMENNLWMVKKPVADQSSLMEPYIVPDDNEP